MEGDGSGPRPPNAVAQGSCAEAGREPASAPESQFLRELQRDLYTLSAAVRRVLEQGSLEAIPNAPVTVEQLRVLRYVTRNPGTRVGEIASRLGMKAPSASSLLDRLESRKLVLRQGGREDQRTIYIEPTDAGSELVAQVQVRAEEQLTRSLSRLQSDEVSALPRLIRRLVEGMMENQEYFSEVCHHCGPGYDDTCPIQHLFGNCPYAGEKSS